MSGFHFVMPTGSTSLVGGPIADFAAGGTKSDTVSMAKYHTAYFFFLWGVGTQGALTMTVIPCDVAGQTTKGSAIPFQYRRVSSTETNTDWVWATSDSLLTTVASEQMYVLKVSADNLPTVSGIKYEYCYVNVAETTDHPLIGGGFVMMADPRGDEATLDAVTT